MTHPDFTLHLERLLALRARLKGDTSQMEQNALSKDHANATGIPTELAELASDNIDQELTLSLLGNEKVVLGQIKVAIDRIEDGTYGQCEGCSEPIPEARLEALPYAALCVRCASRREKGGGA